MAYSRSDLENIAKELQKDLTGIKTRLADLQRGLAALPDDKPQSGDQCPRCGLKPPGTTTITEHLENVHGVRAA